MYIVYMAGRPPRQKAKNDARQQLCCKSSDVQVRNHVEGGIIMLTNTALLGKSFQGPVMLFYPMYRFGDPENHSF